MFLLQVFSVLCSLIQQIQCRRKACAISIEHLPQNKEQYLEKASKLIETFMPKHYFLL